MAGDDKGAHSLSRDDSYDDRRDDSRDQRRDTAQRPPGGYEDVEHRVKPAKTSAAAVFALIFGLAALLSVLTIILSPLGLVLGLIGIILGIVGMKMAKRVGVTGKGVAIGGLVLSVLAVLLAAVIAAGVTTFLNNDAAVDRLEQRVQELRDELPRDVEVPTP